MNQLRKLFAVGFISAAVFCGCSVPSREQVDYTAVAQTAIVEITQTFEALPTATSTNTPIPTDTPMPTATDTPVPTPTEEDDLLLISRSGSEGVIDDEMIIRNDAQYASPTPILPTATVYFPDKADFVAALPSPNQFVPNQHFYLTWQIKNVGTSTWSGKYAFHYSEGIQLADQNAYSISETVEPGGILSITMPATAPAVEGTYKTTWVLENPDGIPFYYLNYFTIVGDTTYITEVPDLNPTATPSMLEWMCSDSERSLIQGNGCYDYCTDQVIQYMAANGMTCYANGVPVDNE